MRELFGILLVLIYVVVLPVLLGRTLFKGYLEKLGGAAYYVAAFLFLRMMALPDQDVAALALQPEVHRGHP